LAALWEAIAEKVRRDADGFLTEVNSGRAVDFDSVRSLQNNALQAEAIAEHLDASSTRSIHPVLAPTIRNELARLGVRRPVLVCGLGEMSYEVVPLTSETVEDLVDQEALKIVDLPIYLFRVPRPPMDSPLYHVLIFHEIGHALYRERQLSFTYPPPASPPIASGKETDPNVAVRAAKLFSDFKTASARWAEEFFADAFGLLACGPAYAFASCRILGGFYELGLGTESHPPPALRLKMLVELMTQRSLMDPLPNHIKQIFLRWEKAANGVHLEPRRQERLSTETMDGVRVAVTSSWPEIIKAAEGAVLDVYDATKVASDMQRGRLLQKMNIPPIGDGLIPNSGEEQILRPSQVFGTSWAADFHELEENAGSLDITPGMRHYGEVLLGALDGVEAARLWAENT
jgi:hypothetical protein